MVLSGGKGTYNASRSNQTSHFGDMGGTPRMTGHRASIIRRLQINTGTPIPTGAVAGRAYMVGRGLLSVNPQGSGGVGKTQGRTVTFIW